MITQKIEPLPQPSHYILSARKGQEQYDYIGLHVIEMNQLFKGYHYKGFKVEVVRMYGNEFV